MRFSKYIHNPFQKTEERPTPKAIYNWRIYCTAMLCTTGAILIGYDSGFIGATTQNTNFLASFHIDPNSDHGATIISNIISCFHIAAFGGALFVYPLKYYYGNRIALTFAGAFGVVGSAIMLGSITGNLAPFYLGRVMSGMSVGAASNLTIVYLSEVSPAPIRGQVVAIFEVGWRIGELVGFWINYGIVEHVAPGKKQWIIPVAIQLIPSGLFFMGSALLRESPRWLVQNGREEQALDVLCWLRHLKPSDEYIDWEFQMIRESHITQGQTIGNGIWDPAKALWSSKKLRKRLAVTIWLVMFPNLMGVQSINYYSVTLFEELGVKGQNASMYSTGFIGVAKAGCTAIYISLIVDGVGRRPAFLVAAFSCSIWFWYIGAYLKVANLDHGGDPGPGGQAALGSMYLWIASYILAFSGGPVVWAAEVFEQNVRQFAQAITASLAWVPIFIMAKATSSMIKSMSYGIFFFFASIDFIVVPFVFFYIPETKGIPLENTQMLFEDGLPAWRAHRVVLARLKESQAMEKENGVWQTVDHEKEKEIAEVEFVEDANSRSGSSIEKMREIERTSTVST